MRTSLLAVGAALTALVALAGCTTIPDSSTPQVVQPVVVQNAGDGVGGPLPGDDPRTIVQGFLDANGSTTDPNHTVARQYLSRDERSHWSDARVTIVDHTTVGNMEFARR